MEYGRTTSHLRAVSGGVDFRRGPVQLALRSACPLRVDDGTARGEFTLSRGDTVEFQLRYAPAYAEGGEVAAGTVEQTLATW